MLRSLPPCLLVAALSAGCDTAAKQQKAEEARKAETTARLRETGERMHNAKQPESPTDDPK